jgi:lipoprotein-releasing system permease protein
MSRLPFELFLALRYLRPKRTFVSVITLICIVGVMLAVSVLIVVISVMTGFDHQLREKILGFSPHIRVHLANRTMTNYVDLMQEISSNRLVKGVTPYVAGPVLVSTEPTANGAAGEVVAPDVRGIVPDLESKISVLPSSIVEGKFDVSGYGVLVGREFAQGLGLGVGDRLEIYSIRDLQRMNKSFRKGRAEGGGADEVYLPTEYEIRGIFDVGYWDFDYRVIVCSLENAQDLYGLGEAVQGLMVMLHDPAKASEVRAQLEDELGPMYVINTWEKDYSVILSALVVEKNVMFYILFFIILVAAFGIASALITFVVQKTREIGVLKALGSSSGQIMSIFLSQSLFVGVLGVLAGFGLGMLAVTYRNDFLFFLRRVTGFQLFPAQIYSFNELPALIDFGDIAIICGGSLVICLLAGLLPAWFAGRLRPVEALRHE